MTEAASLPAALPERPEGFTRKMTMHLNFGGDGGAATFDVFNPSGAKMPFGYQYDTRKGGLTGFVLPGREGVATWAEVRAAWSDILMEAVKEPKK